MRRDFNLADFITVYDGKRTTQKNGNTLDRIQFEQVWPTKQMIGLIKAK